MSAPEAPATRSHFDSARSWVTALGAAVVLLGNSVAFFGLVGFFLDMDAELGTDLRPSGALLWLVVIPFLGCALIAGPLYDRFGIRPLLVVGGAAFCGVMVAMSYVSVQWHGMLLFAIGLALSGGLFLAPLYAVVAAWFNRFRTLALGIVTAVPALGMKLLVPRVGPLADQVDWRSGLRWLAVICAGVFVLGLLLASRPRSLPLRQPLKHVGLVARTRAFWQLGVSFICSATAFFGAMLLFVAVPGHEGIPAREVTDPSSAQGFAIIFGYLALTSLARPLGSLRLLKIALFGLPVAFALWYLATRIDFLSTKEALLIAFVVLLGICFGGLLALIVDVAARLFGLVRLGTVVGLLFFGSVAGALCGPVLLGYILDRTDSVVVPILLAGAISTVGFVVLLPLRRRPPGLPTYLGPGDPVASARPLHDSPPEVFWPIRTDIHSS